MINFRIERFVVVGRRVLSGNKPAQSYAELLRLGIAGDILIKGYNSLYLSANVENLFREGLKVGVIVV